MTEPDSKLRSLQHAAGLVRDGDVVAIGGETGNAHPMALVREIARQGKRGLNLICSRGIALDLLVGARCVATVETAPAEAGANSPALDRAMAAGTIRVVERSRALMLARLQAAASGAPFMVAGPDLASSRADPAVTVMTDPFTGLSCTAVLALRPDIAIIHSHGSDDRGTVQCASTSRRGEPADVMLARSARIAIVSVEQIVSDETIAMHPLDTVLSPPAIGCVVETPYGAHPGRCEARYDADGDMLDEFRIASRDPAALDVWLDHFVHGPADHWAYLDRVGSRRLLGVSRNRNRRA